MRRIAPLLATAALLICFSQGVLAQGVGQLRNGLPPTNMDSFVFEAGGSKELIYGDEGVWDIPPYFEFTKDHRINTGITDRRYTGLTTGHSEFLPDAWGADEFIGNEWDMSGSGVTNGAGPKAPDGSGPAQFGGASLMNGGPNVGGMLAQGAGAAGNFIGNMGAAASAIPGASGMANTAGGIANTVGAINNATNGTPFIQPMPMNQQMPTLPFSTASLQSGF